MQSNFKINKKANFFVFLGEISGVRKSAWEDERKKEWIRLSGGKLSKLENGKLSEFKTIFKKNNYNYIEALFFSFENLILEKELKKIILKDDINIISQTFNIFEKRFEKIWKVKEKKLRKNKIILEKNESKLFNILKIVGIILDYKNKNIGNVPIWLVMSSDHKDDMLGYFSAIGKSNLDIILEYSGDLNKKQRTFSLLVLIHEFFHFILNRNKKIKNIISKTSNENRILLNKLSKDLPAEKILEELFISSFVPEGYLSEFYFKKKIKRIIDYKDKQSKISFLSLRQFCAYKMKNISKDYIINKKKIDKNYFIKIVEILKDGK